MSRRGEGRTKAGGARRADPGPVRFESARRTKAGGARRADPGSVRFESVGRTKAGELGELARVRWADSGQ